MSVPIENIVIQALGHRIRRNTLRLLQTDSYSFTELMRILNVSTGKLNYHLSQMAGFIRKSNETEKYGLTSLGKKAVELLDSLQTLSEQERILLYEAYQSQKTVSKKKEGSFAEFLWVVNIDYLDELIDKMEAILNEVPGYNRDQDTKRVAVNIMKLGLKLNRSSLCERGKTLISCISLKQKMGFYHDIGKFILKNTPTDPKGYRFLKEAVNIWKKELSTREDTSDVYTRFHNDFAIMKSLKEHQQFDLLQEGKSLICDHLLKSPYSKYGYFPNQPQAIAQLAKLMIGIESKEQILNNLHQVDKLITAMYKQPEFYLAEKLQELHIDLTPVMYDVEYVISDLQVAIAKYTHDRQSLNQVLRACRFEDPLFMVVPKAIIAKTLFELKDATMAHSIFTEICDYLLAQFKERDLMYSAGFSLLLRWAVTVAEICLSVNLLEYAKKILPLLKYRGQQTPLKDPTPLLIQLGEYSQEDLFSEFKQIKKNLAKIPRRKEPERVPSPQDQSQQLPTEIPPEVLSTIASAVIDSFFAMFSESADSVEAIKIPHLGKLINRLAQLKDYASLLEVESVSSEIQEVINQYHPYYDFTPPKSESLPEKIIQAYKMGDLEKTNTLLLKYETQLTQPEQPAWDVNFGVETDQNSSQITQYIRKATLCEIYLKINQKAKARSLLREIKLFYEQTNPLKDLRGYAPAHPPKGLYRRYLQLMVQSGCSSAEIDELIAYTIENDYSGLPFLGLILLENEQIDCAQQIMDSILKPSDRIKKTEFGMVNYLKEKSSVLTQLGEVDEATKILEAIKEPLNEIKGRTLSTETLKGNSVYESLVSANLSRIREVLTKCLPMILQEEGALNSYNFAYTFNLKPISVLLKRDPPDDITWEIWKNAQKILCDLLFDYLEQPPEPELRFGIPSVVRAMYILLELNKRQEIRKYVLNYLFILQEALQKFTPPDLKEQLRFLSLEKSSWKYEDFFVTSSPFFAIENRKTFRFLAQIDFLAIFTENPENPKISYYQLNTTYNRWHRELQGGNKKNFFLYVIIPLYYLAILPILLQLEETGFLNTCAKNMTLLQKKRYEKVAKEPNMNIHDQAWYSNVFELIIQQLQVLLKSHDYETAKEWFDMALTLLQFEDVHTPEHVGKILRMFNLLVAY